jgi:phage anti-repressor protein
MNFNLIEQKISSEIINTVNGRELHAELKVATKYNDWIKRSIDAAYLIEDVDYLTITQVIDNPVNLNLSTRETSYYLTIEAAKSIAMMQRSEIGKRIRDYFIDLEKRYFKAQAQNLEPMTPLQMISNIALSLDETQKRQAVLEVKMEAQEEINETVNSKLHSLSFEIKKAELTHERLTIPEYGKKTGRIISYDDSVIIGKIAFHMSMMNSVPVGEVPDSQYSSLRIYKKEILDYVVPFVFGDSSPDKDSKREVITHGGKKALVPNTFLKMKDLLLDHSVNITIQSIYGRFAAIGIIKYTASGQIAPEDWVLPYVVNVNPVSYQNQQLYWDVSFVQFIKYVLMGQFNVR